MIITIHDDFNLQRIIDSGQCFRPVKISDGRYRFITGKHLLHIQELGDGRYEVDCSRWNWKHTWKPYFDLNASYAAIRRSIPNSDTYLTWAAEYSQGIRILRQDPWEMLITFIISQRKSIPAIRSAVEMLCEKELFVKKEEKTFTLFHGLENWPVCQRRISVNALWGTGHPTFIRP